MKKIFYILIIQFIISNYTAYAQQNAYINDFRVNDDSTNFNQGGARLGVDSSGNFVVAWNDKRNFANQVWNQVYCQIFDKNGGRIGNNFKIGHDTTRLLGLTMLRDGRFVVFWYTAYNFNQFAELFFQRFDGSGNALSPPTRVVDSTFSSLSLSYGDVASDSIGNFVIAWDRLFGSSFSILYCQRFDSSGNKIGNPVIANEPTMGVGVLDTKVCMDFSGNFVCCWRDNRNSLIQGKADIFMQRFNFNGLKIGSNVIVNDDNDSTKEQALPWISCNGTGNFVVTWSDRRNLFEEINIYYQVYDSTGTTVGVNRRADQSNGDPAFSKIALTSDSRFFIGWSDDGYAGRNQYYGRRFTKTGEPIGSIYMIPQSSPGSSTQSPSDIKIWGDRVYSVWGDSRNGNNDIYCNVRSFQNPDTVIIGIEPVSNVIPSKFKVHQPYPNPFNPETKVKYELPKSDAVSLRVFDITGREAAFLNLGMQQRGVYEIVISGEYLSSGIYFLQLQTGSGFIDVKKLVLIK